MSAWLKVPGFKKGLMSNLIGPESQVKRVFWSSCSSRSLTLEFYFFLLMLLTKFYNNTNFSVGVNFCTASSSSNAHTIAIAKDLPAFAANALKVFSNPTLVRKEIYSSLKGKTGIYMFFNKKNGSFYIGSAVDLSRRVNYYFQNCYFKHNPNSIIGKAILKYGMANFSLVILEFCDEEILLSRETHYIATYNPAYNILKEGSSLLGYKHKLESILKIGKASLGRVHSAEVRSRISESQKSRLKELRPLGFPVLVLDLLTNNTTNYLSIAQAAKELGLNSSSISKRINKGIKSAFKGRYIITVNQSQVTKPLDEKNP